MSSFSAKSLTALAIAIILCQSDAFLPPIISGTNLQRPGLNLNLSHHPLGSQSKRSNVAKPTTLFMSTSASAMDRLSDACINAISFAQDASRSIGMKTLENEMLLVGMVRLAGADDIEARKIFTNFGIFPDGILQAAESVLIEKGMGMRGASAGNSAATLPFSESVKKTLNEALSIAERMFAGSDGTVLPGHVLLALLEYDDRYKVATEDVTKCGGLAVLQKTVEDSPLGSKFDGTKFCRTLAEYMKDQVMTSNAAAGSTTEVREREVIVVGRNSGSTPTLDKVGVDLTEMAREGRLDAVYGRDYEIRMCLRTLGRRRKSNPCLIGEPGVGKTAIAEGVAQCLAGGYFVYDDKGANGGGWGIRNPFGNKESEPDKSIAGMSKEEINKLPPLPPCPRALQGFRVVSVDLASLIAGT